MRANKTGIISLKSMIIMLLVSVYLFHFCKNHENNFTSFLYELSAIAESERQIAMQNWLKKFDEYPIIENDHVIFIYRQDKEVPIYLSGDMNSWQPEDIPFLKIIGTGYYYSEQIYPRDASLEYKFVKNGNYFLDPLNKKTSTGGYGENSILHMPDYEFPVETLSNRFQNYTLLDTLEFSGKILADKRNVYVFRHLSAAVNAPLIVFHDGSDYLNYAQAHIVLDNLILDDKIPPSNAIFIDPVDRMAEQRFNDGYLKMVFKEILPFIKKEYQIAEETPLYMGGVSLSGLVSFYALKNFSDELTGVFSQSGAFWIDSLKIINELENTDFSKVQLFFDYGTFEKQRSVHNQLISFLDGKQAQFTYNVNHEGHNWSNWKGHLDDALINLLNERVVN